MGSNDILVREYLESLKEDTELDYLFPILLPLMGFKIITTAKESKGQPQYGKDIIATGVDENGIHRRFYFELKGHSDKDITQTSFLKPDGIRESILEAKITDFSDSSITGFNRLPVQIVLVHNGVLKSNTRRTFEDFISKEFPDGGFERWDIYKLTELFSTHLFGESLFTDGETARLFKRTLVLLDAPDYDFADFYQLVNIQTKRVFEVESRAFKKFFASMNLLSVLIIHYSKENNNLYPARQCITFLLLKVWSWILENKLEMKSPVLREFRKLVKIHFDLLDDYFQRTSIAVDQPNGLFSEAGKAFEEVGFPLRCFDHLNYLCYYFYARLYYPNFESEPSESKQKRLIRKQVEYLVQIMNNNDGCLRPLLDNHSISVMNVTLFFLRNCKYIVNYKDHISTYIGSICDNISLVRILRGRFPELYNNLESLVEFVATNERPHQYQDSSSLLITYLFEILTIVEAKETYDFYREGFSNKIDLQMAYSSLTTDEFEPLTFEKNLFREMYVKTTIALPEDIDDFRKGLLGDSVSQRSFRTDNAGFPFLRTLAGIFFKNEFLPDEWRRYLT